MVRGASSGSPEARTAGAATGALSAASVLGAGEVIVVLGDRLPSYVEAWLDARLAAGREVIGLGGPWCAPDYLHQLLRHGYRLYDTALVSAETQLFLDRQHGYRLPAETPVSHPAETAGALMWQRVGAYLRLVGRVSAVYPAQRTFQLAELERAWLVVPPRAPLPALDAELTILARAFWGGSAGLTQVFEAVACWPAPAGSG